MTRHVHRRLASISEEIARARTELSILREQLVFHAGALEDARVRKLVAETPLADREFHVAAEDHRRIDRAVGDAERRLTELVAEQDRLLAALAAREVG